MDYLSGMSEQKQANKRISMADAAAIATERAGVQVSTKTVNRWCHYGVRGVVLESIAIGGRRFTSVAWLDEFFARVKEQDENKRQRNQNANGNPRSPADIRRGNAAAEKKLREKNAL